MPSLILLTVCERVIVDGAGLPSIISIFSSITVNIAQGAEIPQNALSPKEWTIFGIWDALPEDIGQEFDQIFEIKMPNGEAFLHPITMRFRFDLGKPRQLVIGNVQGIPIAHVGRLHVISRLVHNGAIVQEPAPVGFEIRHEVPAAQTLPNS